MSLAKPALALGLTLAGVAAVVVHVHRAQERDRARMHRAVERDVAEERRRAAECESGVCELKPGPAVPARSKA